VNRRNQVGPCMVCKKKYECNAAIVSQCESFKNHNPTSVSETDAMSRLKREGISSQFPGKPTYGTVYSNRY